MDGETGQRSWFRRRPRLTLSAIALTVCVVTVIFAELAARALFPEWIPATIERVEFWTYDDLLGWAHAPGYRGRFIHRDFSVEVAANSHGLRDSEYSTARNEKKRMLVLGDSFGWGFGVEHHEIFSEILEADHPDWEIINACVPGYGTDQQFLYLKERGLFFKPDVILVLFCVNDFDENVQAELYWHFKPMFVLEDRKLELQNVPVPGPTTKQRLQRFLLGTTYLGPKLNSVKDVLVRLVATRKDSNEEKATVDMWNMRHLTRLLIKAIHELCDEHGVALVLASVPMDSEKRAFIQKIAGEQKFAYLPLDGHFDSAAERTTFAHDGHWNSKGHEIAAGAIDSFLWKSGVIDESKLGR